VETKFVIRPKRAKYEKVVKAGGVMGDTCELLKIKAEKKLWSTYEHAR
jgi:hypothetical protein